jgi:hypothetical protein
LELVLPQLIAIGHKRIVYAVSVGSENRKIFQTMFLNDGSLTVHFPYLREKSCMLTIGRMPSGKSVMPTLRVGGVDARCASHHVKYSHHLDGRVHFSQDGKVYTAVKRQAVPLRQANGHLFTLKVQNLADFGPVVQRDRSMHDKKRFLVNFEFPAENSAFQFIGSVYNYADFQSRFQRSNGPPVGPIVDLLHPVRGQLKGVVSRNANDLSDDSIFVLSAEAIPKFSTDLTTSMLFVGGFDPVDIVYDHSKSSDFLFMSCPLSPNGDVTSSLINIDYPGQ